MILLYLDPVNLDNQSVVTPVNVKVLKQLLTEYKYDPHETEFLVEGFTNDFFGV